MRRKKVLIADDDRHVRDALRVRLRQWGYAVVESSDGFGVIAQTTREDVDAMILDQGMPLGDGRCVARILRRESDAPIIFLSGHPRESFRETVMRLPDVYYLPKPLDADRLRTLLENCIGPGRADHQADAPAVAAAS